MRLQDASAYTCTLLGLLVYRIVGMVKLERRSDLKYEKVKVLVEKLPKVAVFFVSGLKEGVDHCGLPP